MRCPKCGMDVSEELRVCTNCGYLFGDKHNELNQGFGRDVGREQGDFTEGVNTRKDFKKSIVILSITAGLVCMALAIVLLMKFVIPKVSNKEPEKEPYDRDVTTSIDESKEETQAESSEEDSKEEVSVVHSKNLSHISVSVTKIQPPEIVDESVKEITIGRAESDNDNDGHGADMLLDQDISTFWDAAAGDDGSEIRLAFKKEESVSILELCYLTGTISGEADSYEFPDEIVLVVDGYEYPLTFSEQETEQYIVFSEHISFSEILLKVKNGEGSKCAISEIRAYG